MPDDHNATYQFPDNDEIYYLKVHGYRALHIICQRSGIQNPVPEPSDVAGYSVHYQDLQSPPNRKFAKGNTYI